MRLFVIPSWYPSRANPMAGIFVREQVAALAWRYPDWDIVVSGWGWHNGALSLRDPRPTLKALAWRAGARSGRWVEGPGWMEVTTPRLSWTLAVSGGGVRGLLSATVNNFKLAQKRLGGIDLVHAHVGFPAGWIASQIKADFGVPYVLTEHMSPFPTPELMAGDRPNMDLRVAFDKAGATTAVSPALAGRVRHNKLPCTDVVPNVVDESSFRLAPFASRRPMVLLSIGRLTEQKGMDVLLKAFAKWNPPRGSVLLRIAGAGPDRAGLHALAKRLDVDDRVQWLGALSPREVAGHIAASHALVLASRHETFGVVVAEGLMCGRPALVTHCGGPESLIEEGLNGYVVRPDDENRLAMGLDTLVANWKKFDPQAIRADALARFSRAAVADQLASIYERVLSKQR